MLEKKKKMARKRDCAQAKEFICRPVGYRAFVLIHRHFFIRRQRSHGWFALWYCGPKEILQLLVELPKNASQPVFHGNLKEGGKERHSDCRGPTHLRDVQWSSEFTSVTTTARCDFVSLSLSRTFTPTSIARVFQCFANHSSTTDELVWAIASTSPRGSHSSAVQALNPATRPPGQWIRPCSHPIRKQHNGRREA